MKKILVLILSLYCYGFASSQEIVKLWEKAPPTDNKLTGEEVNRDNDWITNISEPDIAIYKPTNDSKNTPAVLICPGGGYGGVAYKHEGQQFAQWLNTIGITGVVLKYRMPNKHKSVPMEDVHQAMHYLRSNAVKYGINPNKLGIAGFSAGGHLAAIASTQFLTVDGNNVRPDFAILFYPVTTLMEVPPGGTCTNLLGENPSRADLYKYSVEKQVNNATPPTIILLSNDDDVVSSEHSIIYYNSLRINNIPSAMYIFPKGGHGWGMHESFKYHKQMLSLLKEWLIELVD